MALHIDLDIGDAVRIGADTVVRVERKSGGRVKLAIESEYRVRLERKDKLDRPDPAKVSKTLERPKLA